MLAVEGVAEVNMLRYIYLRLLRPVYVVRFWRVWLCGVVKIPISFAAAGFRADTPRRYKFAVVTWVAACTFLINRASKFSFV